MDPGLAPAIALALAFALTNGIHDSANAIGTLVATRAATPGQAVLLAAGFNLLGPLLFGGAVASTVATIVDVPQGELVPVAGAALAGAVAWNALTWRLGLPSSSSHALLGGLVGAALAEAGTGAVDRPASAGLPSTSRPRRSRVPSPAWLRFAVLGACCGALPGASRAPFGAASG